MKLDLQDPTLLQTQALIDGEWVDATSGQEIDVIDPGTGDCVAKHARAGRFQVRSIAAATAAKNGKLNPLHARKATAWVEEAQLNFIHTLRFGLMRIYLRNPFSADLSTSSFRAIGLALGG